MPCVKNPIRMLAKSRDTNIRRLLNSSRTDKSGACYRRSHEIIGSSTGSVTDYQVCIRVWYRTPWDYKLIDGGFKQLIHLSSPEILYNGGNLILPYQASDGNIRVKIIDTSALSVTADYIVGVDPIPNDAHGTPAIIKYGQFYVLVYGSHSSTGILRVAYSTDLKNWTIYDFPLSGNFTYPQLFVWTDGNLYLFIRDSVSATQTVWRLYKCTDITNPSSWSFLDTIVNEGDGYAPYAKIRVESGRLIVAWGRYNYGTGADDNLLMCAYSDDLVTWKNMDGTPVTLPLNSSNSLLYTHTYEVRAAISRAVGDTFYILPWNLSVSPHVLVEKTIGGTLNTYNIPRDYRLPVGLFYHTEGYLRFYIHDSTQIYRYNFDLSSKTFRLEQSVYPKAVYATGGGEEVYGLTDWVILAYLNTSNVNANAHDLLIVTDREKTLPNDEVSVNGKCRTDFGDIRFMDYDGTTKLSYWIEEKIDGEYATFWVRVPNIPKYPNSTTIYLYYGNHKLTTTSNGDDTFLFFDDFEDGVLDTNKWIVHKNGSANAVVEETVFDNKGVLHLAGEPNVISSASIESTFTFLSGIVVRIKHLINEEHYSDVSLGYGNLVGATGSGNWWHTTFENGYLFMWQSPVSGESSIDAAIYRMDTGTYTALTSLDSGGLTKLNKWYILEYIYTDSGELRWVHNGNLWLSTTDTTHLSSNKKLLISQGEYSGGQGGDRYIDYIFIRKFIDPEPSHGAWGPEEYVAYD